MSDISVSGASEEAILADATGQPATDHETHPGEAGHSLTDNQFVTVFLLLAAFTAIEVAVSYIDTGPFFLPVLLGLMITKYSTVVLYFMHVRFDTPIFGRLFYIGLGLAVAVYVAALSMFHFFNS